MPPEFNPPKIVLPPDQQKRYLAEKTEKFLKEFHELERKHGCTIGAYIDVTPNGIVPRMMVVPLPEKVSKKEDKS